MAMTQKERCAKAKSKKKLFDKYLADNGYALKYVKDGHYIPDTEILKLKRELFSQDVDLTKMIPLKENPDYLFGEDGKVFSTINSRFIKLTARKSTPLSDPAAGGYTIRRKYYALETLLMEYFGIDNL